jgi:hypothetical protein
LIRPGLLLLLFTGCAGLGTGDSFDPLPEPAAGDARAEAALRIEIGTGVELYEPLAEGAPVEVVLGPQGGFHIWTSVRIHDPALDLARIDLSARLTDDGSAVGNPSSITASLDAVDGTRERAGMTSFVTNPSSIRGRRVVLHVDVFAEDGRRGSAERTVIPR